jgi:hypothetical protein
MRRTVAAALALPMISCLVLAGGADADVRRLEAVGAVRVDPENPRDVAPRDAAISKGLREAVFRVAQEFLDDRSIELSSETEAEPDLGKVLGRKMVPYTARFRVLEDQGLRPALFGSDSAVANEYVVIVEVDVDTDRVLSKLVEAGLIPAGTGLVTSTRVQVEVDGLTHYAAYEALREFLMSAVGARGVYPVELEHGRTVLEVDTEGGSVELLERILQRAPPEFEIMPLHAATGSLHLAVNWSAPAKLPED